MANIFTFLQDIIVKKSGDLLNDIDNEAQLSPYMLQRWISFYDVGLNKMLNHTINRLYPAFETKEMWYRMFLTLIPKSRFRKINYIKKTKEKSEEKKEDKKVVEFIAKNQQLSVREVELYIKLTGMDLKDLKKKL